MAVTLQPEGVGGLAYQFYLVDFAADSLPTPPTDTAGAVASNATAFVLETRRTFVWRPALQNWSLYIDDVSKAAALTNDGTARLAQLETWMLRELREIRKLLLLQAGMPQVLDPLPEIDVTT